MLALASQPLLSIGDTAMIGRLGVEPLAARAIGAAIIGGIYWIFAFLSFGTTTLVGYHHGAHDLRACGETYLHARESLTFAFISPALHLRLYFLRPWDSSAASKTQEPR